MHNKVLHKVSHLLVIVGGLNWLSVGLADLNLVSMLVGAVPVLERGAYILVGFAAIYMLVDHAQKCCQSGDGMGGM